MTAAEGRHLRHQLQLHCLTGCGLVPSAAADGCRLQSASRHCLPNCRVQVAAALSPQILPACHRALLTAQQLQCNHGHGLPAHREEHLEQAPKAEVWSIEKSIWRPRLKESDARAFLDTPTCLERMCEADWKHAVAKEKFSSMLSRENKANKVAAGGCGCVCTSFLRLKH